jgi:hypothetical protein
MRYPMPFATPAEDADTDDWLCGDLFPWNDIGEDVDYDVADLYRLRAVVSVEAELVSDDC